MKKSNRLIFFGTEEFSVHSLETLVEAGWNVAAVVTKPDKPRGRGQAITPSAIKNIAETNNIPVLQPERPMDVYSQLADIMPTGGVLVSYGAIIPQSVIDLFPGGIVNVHPSLLPLYRGPAPIEATILKGDTHTGISLMQLTAKMDAGPVFAQKRVALNGDEDQISLSEKLAVIGAHFLIEKLHLIASGFLQPHAQDESQATYTKLLEKENGKIDWSLPAEIIERQVRAYIRFPRSYTSLKGRRVLITKVRIANGPDDGKLVKVAKPGWIEILELIGPSGRKMSGADFIRGYAQMAQKEEN